ncbi:cytochrome C oxidase subunit III [Ectobacillus ponti]|uniref:Cytochrome C oxidase subunit III n=1 Tax=Ectobacillus ponti TaxID=2961894 RepID=A0AA41X704_9BACI|nr:cytochrome C oxidase subunit III [Ectobacillus ponti]MCP8968358.1 cytochrome C oxidase subunit III [Ectobacillus ponti]
MNNRQQHGISPWQYHQMHQQAMQKLQQQGYTKKKGCNCGKKKQVIQDDQQTQRNYD